MTIALEVSDLTPVATALLGGLIGAVASHFLTKRREESARKQSRTERKVDEDREQILVLGDAIHALRREFGGFDSKHVDDGTKIDWGDEERERALEYAAALDGFSGTLQTVSLRVNDAYLQSELGWTSQLIRFASEALREAQPSPAAFLVHQTLTALEQDADAFLHERRPPSNDLQWAFYDELTASLHQRESDANVSAFMRRVRSRWGAQHTIPSSRSGEAP